MPKQLISPFQMYPKLEAKDQLSGNWLIQTYICLYISVKILVNVLVRRTCKMFYLIYFFGHDSVFLKFYISFIIRCLVVHILRIFSLQQGSFSYVSLRGWHPKAKLSHYAMLSSVKGECRLHNCIYFIAMICSLFHYSWTAFGFLCFL